MCDDFKNGGDWLEGGGEITCEAPRIEWEWNPGDVGPYGDGVLVITAYGDGFVMLEGDERTRTGMDEATLNIKAEYGQTVTVQAYIARAGSPISPITEEVIRVPDNDDFGGEEETCEAPKIEWEWNPGDVGSLGDGNLVITAYGNGFVMLEADGMTRTGMNEATLYFKAEYGQTVTVQAYIAKAGSPISPITEEVIQVPGNDDFGGEEETCEAPKIEWEWNPGDVGSLGDGNLVITAYGNGFVVLEADGMTRTGMDEATLYLKAEYGQTIYASAHIAVRGTPVSPTTMETIKVPNK